MMEPVFTRVVFTIPLFGGIPVRDTVVTTWIIMVMLSGLAFLLGRRRPFLLEVVVDLLLDLITGMMGRPAASYLPLLGTLAIFIATANLIGIIPSIPLPGGTIFPIVAPTRDINTPLALALTIFCAVYYYGFRTHGVCGYVKKLASPVFMLPLELISQVSRTLSLSLRLFGNVLSGELIVAVVAMLAPLIVPLPLQVFTMITGVLQSYIFTTLATVYIGAAVEVATAPTHRDSTTNETSHTN
ncbi:MAG: F0F1 ATP synthase subunit A [Chloroflexi bacterium]|nr:F0F1 ATP synthase subunit A [Chloroflexota bacterium]